MMNNVTPMSMLHELMMQRKSPPPFYELIERVDTQVGYKFFVKAANIIAVGAGRNKKEAKHNGAAVVLRLLELKGVEHKLHKSFFNQSCMVCQQQPPPPPPRINNVGLLMTFCRTHQLPSPTYMTTMAGPQHQAVYTVLCSICGYYGEASAGQKKCAKQQSAADLLEKLSSTLPDSTTESPRIAPMARRQAIRRRNKRAHRLG